MNRLPLIFLLTILGPSISSWSQPGPGTLSLANRWVSTRDTNKNQNSVDNWLDADYRYGDWRGGLRFEVHDPLGAGPDDRLSQRYLEFTRPGIKIRAGTFYERFGRGLVFHSFEIRSQTVDGIERELALDRNIDGANLELQLERLDLTAIVGNPPAGTGGGRGEPLGGAEVRYHLHDSLVVGGSFLRAQSLDFRGDRLHEDIAAMTLDLTTPRVDLYVETATKQSSRDLASPDGNAVYVNINYYADSFGISSEFKRYDDFETDFNNPPALVKTHSFALLNRKSHSLFADDEMGFQMEAYGTLERWGELTLHASGADNLDHAVRRKFREYFVDLKNDWNSSLRSHLLLDYAQDRPVGDKDRWTAVAESEYRLDLRSSLLGNFQLQQVNNENRGSYTAYLGLATYSRSPWVSVSLQHEWTDDPGAARKRWTSGTLSLTPDPRNTLLLTIGSQPAGLVCSGGICTLVPEFRGASARWNFRL